MTGKSYSIREMKTIVEYLTENKLYGEIKGRKMWVDYANSQQTTRTWQSLKETFLKRILPDIHNPYYKLTIEQVNSFRAGYDIHDKNKDKLEIHTVSDDSNSNDPKNTPVSNNGNGVNINEENIPGENVKPSKIPSRSRSSADTVIVDTCYETAEDIQKDLEGTGENMNKETRSLRDCITYSEPLTPMLQEVLDDFQSEPENEPEASDRENQLETVTAPDTENIESINEEVAKIVNENNKTKNDDNDASEKDTETTNNQISKESLKEIEEKQSEPSNKVSIADDAEKEPEIFCLDSPNEDDGEPNCAQKDNVKKTQETEKDVANETFAIPATNNPENTDVVNVNNSNSAPIQPSVTLNNSNTQSTDASLPNNPEALNKRSSKENQDEKPISPVANFATNTSRKRSNSETVAKTLPSKKTRLGKKKTKATSETDSRSANEITANNKLKIVEEQTKEMEVDDMPNQADKATDKTVDTVIDQNLSDSLEKPSTSKSVEIDNIMAEADEQSSIINDSSETKNPCLQNVSLFDEQFGNMKYSTSESDLEPKKLVIEDKNIQKETENKEGEVPVEKNEGEKQNEDSKLKEVVVLRSDSESDTEEQPNPPKKRCRPGVSSKVDRERALANVFGFSSGAPISKRRRQLGRRRRTISQNIPHNNGGSNSSEWTSESDSETYVSPPRGRKNRQTRKYLKPQSGRILSLEEEGGLFVMYGKKIYPLVKDGKLVKNYLTYLPESDSEEEENYWKLKYVEEKKKADELKKLLEKAKEPRSRRSNSSTAQPAPSRKSLKNYIQPEESTSHEGNEICLAGQEEKKQEIKSNSAENIKIKFTTKNDQEIHLEGNWPQIHNVLEHVVHIFHKEPQPVSARPKTIVEPPSSSGMSTPVVITPMPETSVDPDVHEKVNKIESEIFKEIEERDKEAIIETIEPETNNVTKRKAGRSRKSDNSTVPESPAKRLRSEQPDSKEMEENNTSTNETTATEPEANSTNDVPKRQGRTPRKVLNETANVSETTTVTTRRSKQKHDTSIPAANEDEGVRYMFPPRSKRQSTRTTDKKTSEKPQKSMVKSPKSFSSPESACPNSVDSTQGYQDSDPSPLTETRKKKRTSYYITNSKAKSHIRRNTRQKLHPYLYTDDSSNSSCGVPIKKVERDNSTLNTEIYKSESYQLLMARAKNSFVQLEPIDETELLCNRTDYLKRLDAKSKTDAFSDPMISEYHAQNSDQINSDIGSSSNVSLPMSPELSLVENLSISKKTLSAMEDGRTINEMMQFNDMKEEKSCSQYMISGIDASVPLMQQECKLESCNSSDQKKGEDPRSLVSESLISKIGTFNIEDLPNVTDTLDVKLRDLLLESAKKIEADNILNRAQSMEVDESNVQVQKKAKGRKRCSTPRKRKDSLKSKKAPKIQALIEEEHIESCSHGGRQSCPPVIQTLTCDINPVNEEIANLTINEKVKTKAVRRKKDIIKVKILKPKAKKSNHSTVRSEQESKISVCTDSGINDTAASGILPVDISVDLIHNHSETCLHANECVSDSLEFVENSMKSVLTLGDSMQSDGPDWNSHCEFSDAQNISPDFYCNNAQDDRSFYKPKPDFLEDGETVYHSPASSLLTEDLSDDPPLPKDRLKKWYLLSEDETTNTNMGQVQPSTNVAGFGANLKQIFPLTCAVPDLSTITEMSRENDDSRKPTLEGATGDGFNSQSILDSNF